MLEHQADAIASSGAPMDRLAFDVRRALTVRLVHGEPEIEHVARDLAMSSRTLQRRLSSAGLSYQELLDAVRRETAERHIAEARLSVSEIAYLVGYSEPAAFHRAFKRWTGVTPQAFRSARRARIVRAMGTDGR
jgi:AraC-like DNA-binding protein